MHTDATAEFYATLNDPRRWIIKPGVPVFKQHQRTDPSTNQVIKVDLPKLYRIAANMQRMEREGGVPARGTLGHTAPGKPETEQPPVAVWYRNARVAPFGPRGEPAIVADEWLDPQYADSRKNFPFRSAEYYDDTEQITGVALLTRDPYLDLGVVAYSRSTIGPTQYSASGAPRPGHQFVYNEEADMTPAVPGAQAVAGGVPPAPQTPVPTPYSGYPAPAPTPQPPVCGSYQAPQYPAPQPVPTPYSGYPGAAAPYGQNIGHPQNQNWQAPGVASYNAPGMSPPQPGARPAHMEPDGDEPLHNLHHHLTQAAAHLSRYLGRNKPAQYTPDAQAMDSPFPAGQQGGMPSVGVGTADQPYSRYSRDQQPQILTISGQPVGSQLTITRLQAELAQTNQAVHALMYERDQADGVACAAEIGRLAALGYAVGEAEVHELKSKRDPAARQQYLQTIMTKYQRVGTEPLPPILGDPTAAMTQQVDNRPATQEEMEVALRYTRANPSMDYAEALRYARSGQAPGHAAMSPGGQLFQDPYALCATAEPPLNGHHG